MKFSGHLSLEERLEKSNVWNVLGAYLQRLPYAVRLVSLKRKSRRNVRNISVKASMSEGSL